MANYLQICKIVLNNGLGAVKMLSPPPSRRTFKRVVKELDELNHPEEAEEIRRYFLGTSARGVPAPFVGGAKLYSVIEANGQRHIKLPVATLGLYRGDKVMVEFKEGHTIARVPSSRELSQ